MVASATSVKPTFRASVLSELRLDPRHVVLLEWFLRLRRSPKASRYVERASGIDAVWVKRGKALSDLPYLSRSRSARGLRVIQRLFDELCGIGASLPPERFPLYKVHRSSPSGLRCYYGVRAAVIAQLRGKEPAMSFGFDLGGGPVGNPASKALERKRPLRPEILELVEGLLHVHVRGRQTARLFRNRAPLDAKHYTKALEKFGRFVTALYAGTFLRECSVSRDFVDRNANLIPKDFRERLDAVKGSWEAVSRLVWAAAKNYRTWFWEDREPEAKEWLPTELSEWLYCGRNSSSLFLACLAREAYPMAETATDRVYEALDSEVIDQAERLLQPEWDEKAFWCRVRDVVRWYREWRDVLVQRESNAGYWFDGGLVPWFRRYVDWLISLAGGKPSGLYVSQLGLRNATWRAWCRAAARDHSLDQPPPDDLREPHRRTAVQPSGSGARR